MPFVVLVLVFATTLVAGCQAEGAGDDRREIMIGGADWTVLVAAEDGMRHRDDFGDADGMLFDLGRDVDPGSVVFVMDGVSFPLDVAWFTDAGTLVGVAAMTPCDEEPCPTYAAPGPYRWAVEAPAGAFDDLEAGDRLDVGPSGAGG